ncbi:hypothetical protein M405DRAFT_845309 [Rhizopogon salebrosus TDB-379]|nr:hypothetical protein M405DRAFT_845309 [Rhizopogon salebrosus TDB-379]
MAKTIKHSSTKKEINRANPKISAVDGQLWMSGSVLFLCDHHDQASARSATTRSEAAMMRLGAWCTAGGKREAPYHLGGLPLQGHVNEDEAEQEWRQLLQRNGVGSLCSKAELRKGRPAADLMSEKERFSGGIVKEEDMARTDLRRRECNYPRQS